MKNFPFLTSHQALILLRFVIPMLFVAHAVVRICNGTIPQFATFLANKGIGGGTTIVVWTITIFEIVGGILLALGYFTKWLSLGFILLLLSGIALIHFQFGWFVGEHGTGGMEYSVALIFALLVIATTEKMPNENNTFKK